MAGFKPPTRPQVDSLQEVDAEEEIEESSRAKKKKNEQRPVIDKERQEMCRCFFHGKKP